MRTKAQARKDSNKALARGRAVHQRKAAERKVKLSEECLNVMREAIGDDTLMAMVQAQLEKAMEGDTKAFDVVGKYFFGGGKIDLREVEAPSILKRK